MTEKKKINRSMTPLEWGLLLFLTLLWSGSFFFNGVAVKELPFFTVVVYRVGFAAILLHIFMWFKGLKMPMSLEVWRAFLAMGLLNNVVPFSLIVWGQSHIASGVASILNATTPLFAVVVAHLLTQDEKLSGNRLFGVLLGMVGVALMIGIDALRSLGVNAIAQLAIMGASLSYAFAGVFGRRFRQMEISPVATATGQVTASTLVMIPIALYIDQPWTLARPGFAAIGAIAGLAALSTALAYILYFRILATAGATNLLLVTFLVPVGAILLGIFFLDEVLLPKHLIGMALIGAGLAAIDGRIGRAFRAAKQSDRQ